MKTTEELWPLSRLTHQGIRQFERVLAEAPGMSVPQVREAIGKVLTDGAMTERLDAAVEVPVFPMLATRADVAQLAAEVMRGRGDGPSPGEEPVYSWLAMVWLPALCKSKGKRLQPGERARYILSTHSSDFYRHLVACPHWLRQRHGVRSRLFTCQPAYVMPEVVEQIASRPWLIESDGAMEVIDRLYWDDADGRPRTGFTATTRHAEPPPGMGKTVPDPGTLRALEMTLAQLQCNYDLRSMSAEQILAKLPAEFDAWRRD
jgi:hypothetical protein